MCLCIFVLKVESKHFDSCILTLDLSLKIAKCGYFSSFCKGLLGLPRGSLRLPKGYISLPKL